MTKKEERLMRQGWEIKARRKYMSQLADIAIPKGYKRKTVKVNVGGRDMYALFYKPGKRE